MTAPILTTISSGSVDKHTAGRLFATQLRTHGANPKMNGCDIGSDDGTNVALVLYRKSEHDEAETVANARRLVACWNACAGISTEKLEASGDAEKHSAAGAIDAREQEIHRAWALMKNMRNKEAYAILSALVGWGPANSVPSASHEEPPAVDAREQEAGALIFKLECFIDHATGGKLSKSSWALETLKAAHNEHLKSAVDEALKDHAEWRDAPDGKAPNLFSCHLKRDQGKTPCATDCLKLRCSYPTEAEATGTREEPAAAGAARWNAVVQLAHELDDAAQHITERQAYDFATRFRVLAGLDGVAAANEHAIALAAASNTDLMGGK